MDTHEILSLILTSVGMGIIASVSTYFILAKKYKHTNNKMQTDKTLPSKKEQYLHYFSSKQNKSYLL